MAEREENPQAALDRWEIQLRKGVLEFVVLLALREREQYGFELMSGIAGHTRIDVPEGTLYPLLLRLAREGLVASRLTDGHGGAPRKYYALTPQGRALLRDMVPTWARLAASVNSLLSGAST